MTLYVFQSKGMPELFGFTVDPQGTNLPADSTWERAGNAIPLGVTMASTSPKISKAIGQTGYALVKGYSIAPPKINRNQSVP